LSDLVAIDLDSVLMTSKIGVNPVDSTLGIGVVEEDILA